MYNRDLNKKAIYLLNSDPDYVKSEFDKEKISIIKYCLKYDFKFRFINDLVFIYSLVDEWYFKYDYKGKIKLFHKNTRHGRNKYHIQGKFNNSIACINYIRKHDNYFYKPGANHKFNLVRTKLKGI